MEDAQKFYEWLVKMKSIHLADNQSMAKAYEQVIKNSNEPLKPRKCTQFI
jgi:hypothetical protein